MRSWTFVLLCTLLLPAMAPAQSESREDARNLFVRVSQRFEASLQGVNERQWNYKAPNQKHTIGALAEHAAISANDLQKMVQRALDRGPTPEIAKTLTGQVELVKGIMLNVEQPPENFRPAGRLVTSADVQEYFPQVRVKALAQLDSAKSPEQCVYLHPSKRVGNLTALQWFYYISYLVQAHTEQIERIKLDAGYPK